MINIAIYARMSTKQQENSIEAQVKDIKEALEKVGNRKVVVEYLEPAKHGEVFEERPKLRQLIKDAEMGIFKEVWIWDVDRLARDPDLKGYIKFILRQKGVKIVFVKTGTEFWEEHIKTGIAYTELIQKRERVSSALKVLRSKGIVTHRPPYGFKRDSETGTFVQIEEEALKVRGIYRDRNELGLRRLAKKYNLPISTISYILKNAIYTTGEVREGDVVITKIVPIIKGG